MKQGENQSTFLSTQLQESIHSNKSTDVLILLLQLLESVTQSSDFDELTKKVALASKKLMQVEASSIMLLDGNYLQVVMSTGPVKKEVKGKKIPADNGYAGWVMKNRQPIIANDIQQMGKIFNGELSDKFTTCNLICVPLYDEKKNIIGVLEAINRQNGEAFKESDIPLFQTLADHSASALLRVKAEDKLRHILKEQETFFKEIHHRVKNDFALISGIVEVGNLNIKDENAKKVLQNVRSRIQVVASVYELLSKNIADSDVLVSAYLDELIDSISAGFSSSERDIQIAVTASDFYLDSSTALSCGLIINELLMNAVKHAFNNRRDGHITINVKKEDRLVSLQYRDDGKGFSDDFDFAKQKSLGFGIIQALVKQLNGTIKTENIEGGAACTVRFKTQNKLNPQN